MSKKIMSLLMLIITTMQTNFAMKPEKSSMGLAKLMNGRFSNDLIIKRFSPSYHVEKKSQVLSNQLQELESNKNNLEYENGQIIQDIQKNTDTISRNGNIQMGAIGAGVTLELITLGSTGGFLGGVGFYIATIMQSNNVELDAWIEQNRLRLEGNNELLDKINYDKAKMNSELTQLNERENKQTLIKERKVIVLKNDYSELVTSNMSEIDIRQICKSIGKQNIIYLMCLMNETCHHSKEYLKRCGYYNRTSVERIFIPSSIPVSENVLKLGRKIIFIVSSIGCYYSMKVFCLAFLLVDRIIMQYPNSIAYGIFFGKV